MRYRRPVSAVLVPVMLAQFAGCTKLTWVGPDELRPEEGKVAAVELVPEDRWEFSAHEGVSYNITFDAGPAATISQDTMHVVLGGVDYPIALAQVEQAQVRRVDTGKIVVAVTWLALFAGIVALAVWAGGSSGSFAW